MDSRALISTWVSTGVMVLLLFGLHHRHRPRIHVPVMLTCFVVDVANVLYIELGRAAIQQALRTATEGGEWVKKFHIAVSVLSLISYVVALATGLRLLLRNRARVFHRTNAAVFLLARTLNYITSFYV